MIARNDDCLLRLLNDTYFPLKMPSRGTREDYSAVVRSFAGWLAGTFGAVDFCHVSPESIGNYLLWLQDCGRCGATRAAGHSRVLRAVLKVGRKKGLLAIDLEDIPRPRGLKRHPRAWSKTQVEAIIAAARSLPGRVGPWPVRDWLPALIFTCLSTDWRISAVMHLKLANTSLEEKSAISIETKQHKERCARLTDQCVSALRAIWGPREEVFGDWPLDRGDRQWKELNKLLGKAIVLAGVPDIGRWHAFRKTATTMVADKGGREAAARFAGHSDSRVTAAHYIDDSKLTGPAPSDALPRLRDAGETLNGSGAGSADEMLSMGIWL